MKPRAIAIAALVLIAVVGTLYLSSRLAAPPVKEFTLRALDFGYDSTAGGPEVRVKATE